MNRFFGSISRENREIVLKLLTPFPLLVVLAHLVGAISTLPLPYFLLVYSMFLSTFLLALFRFFKLFRSYIRMGENAVYRDIDVTEDMSVIEQIKIATYEYLKTGEYKHKHISEYERESIPPKATFATLSILFTIASWCIVNILLATLIEFGGFDWIIQSISDSHKEFLANLLYQIAGTVFVLSDPFLPALSTESTIIFAAEVVIPGVFFLTAAENISGIIEEYSRRALHWFHDGNSFIRRYEIVGWLPLSIILTFWILFI